MFIRISYQFEIIQSHDPVPTHVKDKNRTVARGVGRQVTSLLYSKNAIMICRISVYSRISGRLFKVYIKLLYLTVSNETVNYMYEDGIEKIISLAITLCHHSASPMMPIGDLRDCIFYSLFTFMINSYNLTLYSEYCSDSDT